MVGRGSYPAVHMVGRVVTQQYTWLGGQLPSSTHGWEGSYQQHTWLGGQLPSSTHGWEGSYPAHMVGRAVTQQYTWLGGAVTQQYTWLGGAVTQQYT